MIGPSSAAAASKSEPDRICGTKRKAFDDLDIEDFCNDVYSDEKEQYLSELSIPIEDLSSQIIEGAELSSSDMSSMTKLEVLVVDEMWEDANFDQNELVDLNSSSLNKDTNEAEVIESESLESSLEQSSLWHPPIDHLSTKNVLKSAKRNANVSTTISNPSEDQENDLSWLLDFRLDSIIATDDKCNKLPVKSNKTKANRNSSSSYTTVKKLSNDNSLMYSQNYASNRQGNSLKKPPFTYTELIEHALQEKGELTVSAIYQWISDHFPYYKSNDDRWKNSVRHNLSINPHFRKGSKAPHGAGHLWAIACQDESKSRHFLNGNNVISTTKQILKSLAEESRDNESVQSQISQLDEVAAATASIVQQCEDDTTSEVIGSFTLEHSAERILSGLKRDVEVQYLIPMMVSENGEENQENMNSNQHCSNKETDFLNPVSKEIVAEECGLIEEGYLVTDLNPVVLGLNLTEPEVVSPDNLFGEELSFQFYELTSPSQLQSA